MEAVSISAHLRATIKRYLKWYSFPLIYFLLTSLLCAYAWYTRPIPYRSGIKAVFKTIALNPTLILTGIITVRIIIAIISTPIVVWLKKRFPEFSPFIKSADCSQKEVILQELSSNNKPRSLWEKTVNVSSSVLGVILIVAGLSIAAWISRPYITFLFATLQIETLEKKAELLGQTQGDMVKKIEESEKKTEVPTQIPSDETKEKRVLEERSVPPEQVQMDEIKKNVTVDTTAEVPEQIQRNAIKKNGVLEQIVEVMRKDVTKSTKENQIRREAAEKTLEKRAGIPEQVQKDWMIIPTAVVDEPILEGVSMENLSEGVCHVSQSATPGQGGNFIIEGHNLDDFRWWRHQGPFSMLEVLEKGGHIYIFYKGKKYVYKVKEKTYKDVNDPKLYDFTPGERLTLITCTSSSLNPNIYTDTRTVIVAYPQ